MKLKNTIETGISVLAAHIFKKKTPLSVYLSVTDRCNLNCRYCNFPSKKKQRELTTAEIFSLLDQIKEMGAQRFHLIGGEPTLREDIGQIINYAKQKGIYVTMVSNGFMVPKMAHQLKNLDALFISFDGDKRIHEYLRGKGSYDMAMNAIKAAKENRVKVMTTTVLTNKNKDCIDFILQQARKHSFMANFQLLFYTIGHFENHIHPAHHPKSLLVPNNEYRKVIRKLISEKRKGAPISSSIAYLEYLLDWADYKKVYSPREDKKIRCWAGELHCYVDTDGTVYPCGDNVGVVNGQNYLDAGFKSSFENAGSKHCRSCITCYIEQNLMFSLHPGTILNWMKLS